MVSIIGSIKTGMTLYRAITIFLSEAENILSEVYISMAKAHLKSAEQAFSAAQHSRDHISEVRSGINHLRDVYNILEHATHRVKKRYFLFIPYEDKPDCNNGNNYFLINVSLMICLTYHKIGEPENAREWRKKVNESIKYFTENLNVDPHLTEEKANLDFLRNINPEYVETYMKKIQGIKKSSYYRNFRISKKGLDFIDKEIQSIDKKTKRL